MFLQCIFLFSILKFGEPQNQCVREVRSLKADLQIELGNVVRDAIDQSDSISKEDVQELVEDKATKDAALLLAKATVQVLQNNLTFGTELITDLAMAAYKNATFEEFRQLVSDKATKEDVQALKHEVIAGMMDSLRDIQDRIYNATIPIPNSNGTLNPAQQCVTRDEVESVVRSEVQSLTRHVVYIQNSMVQLLQRLYLATPVQATTAPTGTADSVQLYSTDTPEQTTEQSTATLPTTGAE